MSPAIARMLLLAMLAAVAYFGSGCSTAHASQCVSNQPLCPATTAPVCICDDGRCYWVCVGFTP